MAFDSFQLGENSIRIVKQQRRHEKQNSWTDNSIPIRQTYSPASFVARIKRQVEESSEKIPLPTTEITKSSQQIQFTPTFGCFYGTPESINSYQMTGQQQFTSPNYMQQQHVGLSFDPAFLQFQQQQQQQQQQQKQSQHPIMHLIPTIQQPVCCCLSQENSPTSFYCTYIPVSATYQFPVVPGITDFNRLILENTQGGEVHDDFVRAQYSNPFEHLFREFTRDCPVNFYRCGDGSKCVSKLQWCDNYVDCPDGSDETKCSCRERISKARLCDNYPDCPHGEDELGCFGCPKNSFSCNDSSNDRGANNCVSPEQRCDGHQQCTNGMDESQCSVLTEVYNERGNEMFPVGYNVGFLHRNLQGKWYPVCGHAYAWAKDACVAELGALSEEPIIEMVTEPQQREIGPFLTESSNIIGQLIPECVGEIAYVRCPRLTSRAQQFQQPPNIVGAISNAGERNVSTGDPMVSIVGGHDSRPRDWPFVVAINKNGNFHCGGAVLNEWWVLSAAHCFADYQRHYYEIDAGMLRRYSYSPTHQPRHLDVVIIHPSYEPLILRNDIALGLLNAPLYFNGWVRPVRLPEPGIASAYTLLGWRQWPSPGDVCIAVGWGATREGGPDPDHLREVEVPIINCKYPEDRNRAEICAGFKQGGRDACQGDSGGPLMCRSSESSSEWYIGGIVSHGIGCGRRNEPGAYTKVSHFVDWINSAMQSRRASATLIRPRAVCPGFSCREPHAKCLPAKRHCDRVADCLEAEDEVNCPFLGGRGGLLEQLLGQPETTTLTRTATNPTSARRR